MNVKKSTRLVFKNICLAASVLTCSLFASCQKDEVTAGTSDKTVASLGNKEIKLNTLASTSTSKKYKYSAPLSYTGVSNITISGDSINGGSIACLQLRNCTNIHITKCRLGNSTAQGIFIKNCTNIFIDSCYITKVSTGVIAYLSTGIRVQSNQLLNMVGPYPQGCFIQFNQVTGSGNRISFNKCQDDIGSGSNPNPLLGDGISLYMSNGSSSDPIYVIGNSVKGGGTSSGTGSGTVGGTAGICAGDLGGSYQVIEGNSLVNTGYAGIQTQGGTHITIQSNSIYSDKYPWSGVGLASANYSGTASNGNTLTNNSINWTAGYNNVGQRDTTYKAGSGNNTNAMPTGWKSNKVHAAITASILPAVLVSKN